MNATIMRVECHGKLTDHGPAVVELDARDLLPEVPQLLIVEVLEAAPDGRHGKRGQ